MSKAGKILFLFAFLFAGGLVLLRAAYGGWLTFMWVPFALSILLFIGGLAKDWRGLVDFFTLKTTKHGMNMGAAILIALVGVICVNFLGVRYDKKFDWTSDKLNSLSEQSVKAVQAIQVPTEILLLYNPEDPQATALVREIGNLIANYENTNKKIKYAPYDARQRPDLTKKYEMRNQLSLFAIQGDKHVRIDQPTEEGVTRSLLQLAHDKKKAIYFVSGHGEHDLESREPGGLAAFKEDLSSTYEAKSLVLLQTENKIPEDAGMIAIVGPQQQYLESELQALRDFARKGGKLLIAIDPGMKHNLAQLTKTLGVEFNNDYVADPRTVSVVGSTTVSVFDQNNPITRPFTANSFAYFFLASTLKKDPQAPKTLTFADLASSDKLTIRQTEPAALRGTIQPDGPHTMAIAVSGKLPSENGQPENKDFSAVVIGDSDFMTNALYGQYVNRDLAMNSVASLMQDTDLISIRPKELSATKITMLDNDFAIFSILFLFMVPLLLFAISGGLWFRRRLA